ncbi:MAG: HDOD domain-containing protein [Chitinispirillia bacterium]|jgi:putative nucleotidyltransferase with HDIG domain
MNNKKQDELLLMILEKLTNLPSFPQIFYKIENILSDPESSVSDIVNVLKYDPGITSRVLRLANSAYIGIPQTVSSLKNAVIILGQKRIHSLVLTWSILSMFKSFRCYSFNLKRYWKHSVTVGTIGESIAKHLKRYEIVEPEEVFCSGILHDIGKLVLSIFEPETISNAFKEAQRTNTPFFQNEDNSVSHSKIGSIVASNWKFPQNLIDAIQFHHSPFKMETVKKTVLIVHISDILSHMIAINTFIEEEIPAINRKAVEILGLNPEYLRVIAHKTLEKGKQLESLFTIVS